MLVLADSLALVRPEENITEKDLYSYKIQLKMHKELYVVSKAIQNNSSIRENSYESDIYHQRASDCSFLILGLGIVDCSPRLFSKNVKELLNYLTKVPIVKRFAHLYIRFKSKYRIYFTKKDRITETSIIEYQKNINLIIDNIKKYNKIEHIFITNIASPGKALIDKSFGIHNNIKKYNKVLEHISQKENISIIDVYGFTQKYSQYILSDGHHISSEVHDFIGDSVVSFFKSNKCNS